MGAVLVKSSGESTVNKQTKKQVLWEMKFFWTSFKTDTDLDIDVPSDQNNVAVLFV